MARALPGPLVSRIAGAIAGTTFSSAQGGARLTPRRKRNNNPTPFQSLVRQTIIRASHAWPNLDSTTRAAWNAAAALAPASPRRVNGSKPSGRQAFVAAYVNQIGSTEIIDPPAPTLGLNVLPLSGLYQTWDNNLLLMGLSRNLSGDDYAVFRTYKPVPDRLRTHSKTINRYIDLRNVGLTNEPFYSLVTTRTVGDITRAAGVPYTGSFTVEFWFRRPEGDPLTASTLWFKAGGSIQAITVNSSGFFGLFANGTTTVSPFKTVFDQWHYIVATFDAGTTKAFLYVDNVVGVSSKPASSPNLIGATRIGSQGPATNRAAGRFNQFIYSNIVRDSAYRTNVYNAGIGRVTAPDVNTLCLLPLRSFAAGLTPDVSGNGYDFTVADVTYEPGFPVRLVADESESYTPSNRLVRVVSQALHPYWMLAPSQQEMIPW